MPRLPRVKEMSVPFALMMPPPPALPDAEAADEGDGEFVPPQPEDPDNPTGRETLQLAMALMTAMGVAAAQGMWHRARHRSALADQARANADKAAAGRSGSKRTTGSEGSLLRSLGSSGKKTRRSGGGKSRPPRDAHSGSPHGPGRDTKRPSDRKPPKADRGGKTTWMDPSKQKRRDKGGLGSDRACVQTPKAKKPDTKAPKTGAGKDTPKPPKTPKKGPDKLRWKAPKRKNGAKGPKGWTSGRPKGAGKSALKPKRPKLTWKAPKRRPWPGGGKVTAGGRKRWTRGKVKPIPRLRKKSWTRRARKTGIKWFKRWAAGTTTPPPWPRTPSWRTTQRRGRGSAWRWFAHGRRGAGSWRVGSSTGHGTPPPPPPGFGWMRPPPGADRTVRVSSERVDVRLRQQYEPDRLTTTAVTGAPAAGWPALQAGSTTKPEPEPTGQSATKTDNDVKTGVPYMPVPAPRTGGTALPVHGAQFRDAELTIRDVIEAGEETAEEILAGADTAQRSAAMCETLAARLETLHAELCELEVPGILIPNVAVLLDKAQDVRGKALAIAEGLPLASEAMRVASANAAVRHLPTADMTRDMGHIKPAERPYHEE
jgi:hypothetical protein